MQGKIRRILSLVLSFGLLFQQIGFAQVAAELNIANYLSRISNNIVQDRFRPLHLRYFSYDNLNDNFKILLDKGDLKNLRAAELETSTKTLLSYFLVGVALPDEMFWVNLRPDSEEQIVDPSLEKTDVGKIMLEADLQLKKDTATMTSPATSEGREYWDRLYKKAAELYGYDNVTIPTLTRPWIVPGEIIVRESKDSAYVYKATLKVMLEQDYLKNSTTYNFKDERSKALNEYSSQLIRELIIPKLTKEVNSSKRYAALRQVYYSLILSRWFKLRFTGRTGTYASLINTRNLTNLTSQEPWTKTTYFKQYQKSFQDGEYNIKEPVYTPTGQVIRSYFSGGINVASSAINTQNGIILPNDNVSKLGDVIGGKAVIDPSSINLKPTIVSSPIRGEIGFNPLQALKDPDIARVFQQIIERRYDVRVLSEYYNLGHVPEYLMYQGERLSVTQYVRKMIAFLLNKADEDPHVVAKEFRKAFPNMARPSELDAIFDKYMGIKIKEFDLKVLQDAIPLNSIIADIGAGKNKLGKEILSYSDQNNLGVEYVIGTDLNDWRDETSKLDYRLLFIYQESGTWFPLSSNTYDAVIVKWVLHHMTYEDQLEFLKSVKRILKPGGRVIIFESLGATSDESEIWEEFQVETKNLSTWPKGSFFDANLKLTQDFMQLNTEQQRKVHALEDFFGHNLVMGRDWMPQPFTYRPVSEYQELLAKLGFVECKDLRRVYGSMPIMRMGPPSIRIVFEKKVVIPNLINGDRGKNKAMVLIKGITETEKMHVRNVLDHLVYQDQLEPGVDDIVILGNERLDTFSEALDLVNLGIGKRIVILGEFGEATMPLIDEAVKFGYSVRLSETVTVNRDNWFNIKSQISGSNVRQIITVSEANIIRQILMQIINAFPDDFKNLQKRIGAEGIENIVITIDRQPTIRKLYTDYRRLLDIEGAFTKRNGHSIAFLHNPYQQLRSKAAFDEIFSAELRRKKVSIISHTVSYDNIEIDKNTAFKDLLTEAWRIILYSDYGKAYINLRNEKYPKGIDALPQSFWESLSFLFDALQDKQEFANKLISLVLKEELSIDVLIKESKDNPSLRKFIEEVRVAAIPIDGINGGEEDGGLTGSSPLTSQEESFLKGKTPGGIDFRILPMTIQPMGSFNGLNFKLPHLSQTELEKINVAIEIKQIKNMIQSGITPSGERIKELVTACLQKKEMNSCANDLLLCLVDVFKQEEENASESSPELKEALVIVDSQS